MSPLLQFNSLVEKQEGNCALGQGGYTGLGRAHPDIFTEVFPSYSTSSPSLQASPSYPLSRAALRFWGSLDNECFNT